MAAGASGGSIFGAGAKRSASAIAAALSSEAFGAASSGADCDVAPGLAEGAARVGGAAFSEVAGGAGKGAAVGARTGISVKGDSVGEVGEVGDVGEFAAEEEEEDGPAARRPSTTEGDSTDAVPGPDGALPDNCHQATKPRSISNTAPAPAQPFLPIPKAPCRVDSRSGSVTASAPGSASGSVEADSPEASAEKPELRKSECW